MGHVATSANGWSVGAAAAELGVAPETLRSYGRRYGLVPSLRTPGGHRRYTATDLDRLVRMQQLITDGFAPSRAAAAVLGTAPATHPARRSSGGPGGRVLAVPGASREVRGLARAASRLDSEAVTSGLLDHLTEHRAVATWDGAVLPLLVAVGVRFGRLGTGVEIEHVLSESVIDAFRRYRGAQRAPLARLPVLLASAPEEQHVLPLFGLAAALAETRVPHLVLGARVPFAALASARRRTGASVVFIWRQIKDGDLRPPQFGPTRPAVRVVVGGPGWDGIQLPPEVDRAESLTSAMSLLAAPPATS